MQPSVYDFFSQDIELIEGIGSVSAKKLRKLGMTCLGDFLFHLPKSWLDDRQMTSMDKLIEKQEVRIQGCIHQRRSRGFGRKASVMLSLSDDTGISLELSFFHANYMMSDARLQEGQWITARGVVSRWGKTWQMTHPEWSTLPRFEPAWQPKYASIAGFHGKKVGLWIRHALKLLPTLASSPWDAALSDYSPNYSHDYAHDYPSLQQALTSIHCNQQHAPDSKVMRDAGIRLQLEELLSYFHVMRQQRQQAEISCKPMPQGILEDTFIQSLPFPLTPAQTEVWAEISADLASAKRMHRLLQGDVGAGKTWVAALGMLRCFEHDCQSAIMAPTEVLAEQHFVTLNELLMPLGISLALLTGSTKKRERKKLLAALEQGEVHVLVGTHALLTEDVVFQHLSLAIIDEQHRFGVEQRWALSEKGQAVHLLAMTATPIPRSLALALYGDMLLSVMRGLPAGRKTIQTRILLQDKMPALADALARMLAENGRIYWIVPRIDEDEDMTSVDERMTTLQHRFPDEKVLALHGKMKGKDKQAALAAFTEGSCRILVSTTVVEVGVNVPEARVMVIEQADRYGLAQLHQLRGRVGRSDAQSYCMLIPSMQISQTGLDRLALMTRCFDGLELAEADLQHRGAGDAVGTRQSGEAGFRLLDPALDADLIRTWFEHEVLSQVENIPEHMLHFWRPLADEVD
ncbi:MAG: ATP-dependent DNA helicase RecG [Mariprofundaceae bacterium]|nr:ATP-dependent DNA helicase RecG [Mariprofundaceae bacterium]